MQRFYKVKNPVRDFLCALCSAPRSMKYSKKLSAIKYFQILLISISITMIAFPYIGPKSIFAVFIVWMIFEIVNKILYRKEIPCPYCGFDATWYRRDVKVANKLVKDFWNKNYPELVSPSIEQLEQMKLCPPRYRMKHQVKNQQFKILLIPIYLSII